MGPENKFSKEYWDGHSLTDGCVPTGFRPFSWRFVLSNYSAQEEAVKKFVLSSHSRGQMIESGMVDPASLPVGTIVRVEQETLMAERVRSNRGLWIAVLTVGIKNTNFPWAKPSYHRDWDIGVVSDVERLREEPIRGLVTFNEESAQYAAVAPRFSYLTGHPNTPVINIGQVQHSKLMERLQANDRQVLRRVIRVEMFG